MHNDLNNKTIEELDALMIATKREIKSMRKQIASIQHLIDKNGIEAICRNGVLLTVYRKSIRLNH